MKLLVVEKHAKKNIITPQYTIKQYAEIIYTIYLLPTNFQKIMSQYAAGSDKYISNCIALNCHVTLMQYAVILVTTIYHLLVIEKIVCDAIGSDKHFKLYYARL